MAISETDSGTNVLVIGAETTLNTVTPNTTDGVYQLLVDVSNLAAGDVLEIRIKEKAKSGGTQRTIFTSVLSNAQGTDSAAWASPSLILMHGWDMTLKQTAGTGRSFDWSIRAVS